MGVVTLVSILVVSSVSAAQSPAPREEERVDNEHVVAMAGQGVPEAGILAAIEKGPTGFDTSPGELERLSGLGLSANLIHAMVAASAEHSSASGIATTLAHPSATLWLGDEARILAPNRAHVSQVRADLGDDFASVATSTAAQQVVIQAGARVVASTAMKFGSAAAGALAGPLVAAASLFRKSPTYTALLAVPGTRSPAQVGGRALRIEVHYADVAGLDPTLYEPVLLRLTPTQANLRLVRAQRFRLKNGQFRAKDDVLQTAVPTRVTPSGRGWCSLEVDDLPPGEYGVILRRVGPDSFLHPTPGTGPTGYDPAAIVWDFSVSTADATDEGETTGESAAQESSP